MTYDIASERGSRIQGKRHTVENSGDDDGKPKGKPPKKPKKSKGLDPRSKDNLRKFLQNVVDGTFQGNASRAAETIGLSQSMVYEMLTGNRGGGMRSLLKIARITGASVESILGDVVIDRYPSRAVAIGMAKTLGCAPGAIEEVRSYKLNEKIDPPARWWLERILARDRDLSDPFSPNAPPGDPADDV